MTLHVVYDHQCPQCGAYYIPYDDDIPCPACGFVETERFDYIAEAVRSLVFNLKKYRSYIPPGWWRGSLGDHVLSILFRIFEKSKDLQSESDFEESARNQLSNITWGDQEYREGHILSIAMRVRAELTIGEQMTDTNARQDRPISERLKKKFNSYSRSKTGPKQQVFLVDDIGPKGVSRLKVSVWHERAAKVLGRC